MTVPVQTLLQAKAPRPLLKAAAPSRARPQAILLPGLILVVTTLGVVPALASGNESWASDTIEHMRQPAYTGEAGARPRGRRSAVEHLENYMSDEAIRPRRHARRHDRTEEYASPRRARVQRERARKVASLGRHSQLAAAPASATAAVEAPKSTETRAAPPTGPVLASLEPTPPPAPPKASGGPINWVASSNCLASPLRTVLSEVAALFGAVRVNSTCRSKAHNARVGGASHSYHLTGNAVDFRIAANTAAVSRFLLGKKSVGGFKHYGFGVFHIDTGPRRTWDGGPRRRAWASNRRSRRG
jgi:Peptidase M15